MNNDHTPRAKEPWEIGTKVSGVFFVGATPPRPVGQEDKEARNKKRKQTKLETARKRGLLNDVDL